MRQSVLASTRPSASAYAQPLNADPPRAGPGSGTVGLGMLRNAGMAGAVGIAGINYAGVPLPYAFGTADNSRAGPRKPVRCRGTAGVRASRGLESGIPPAVAAGQVIADSSATTSSAFAPPSLVRTGANLYVQNSMRAPGAGSGIACAGSRAGEEGKCMHRRCEGCYDLDANKRVVRFCAGSSVGLKRYAGWYASFGFLDGNEPAVVDGGFKLRQQQWRRGVDVSGLMLEGANGEGSRAEGERSEAPRGEYEGVRLGEGVIAETGRDNGDDGQGSESGGSRGWVEPITFVHGGSQEGGRCSERENEDDVGADGDDEKEEEEQE
jgi:hypothetical protein